MPFCTVSQNVELESINLIHMTIWRNPGGVVELDRRTGGIMLRMT